MIPTSINAYYKLHAPIYDATRWSFLLGRNSLSQFFPMLPGNPTILDLGCGTGKQLQKLNKHYPDGNIIGLDQSSEMLHIASEKAGNDVELINKSYSKSLFQQETFDLIVASYSLSMIPNLPSILHASVKHLKPNGKILVVDFDSTPLNWFNGWMRKNHVYFENDLFRLLNSEFRSIEDQTVPAYFGLYSYSTFLGEKKC